MLSTWNRLSLRAKLRLREGQGMRRQRSGDADSSGEARTPGIISATGPNAPAAAPNAADLPGIAPRLAGCGKLFFICRENKGG